MSALVKIGFLLVAVSCAHALHDYARVGRYSIAGVNGRESVIVFDSATANLLLVPMPSGATPAQLTRENT